MKCYVKSQNDKKTECFITAPDFRDFTVKTKLRYLYLQNKISFPKQIIFSRKIFGAADCLLQILYLP